MTKQDFLSRLRTALYGIPESEIDAGLRFYSEIIDDRMEGGMTEAAAVAALGTPEEVAREIMLDLPLPKLVRAKCTPSRSLKTWELVLLAATSPIWLSLLLVAAILILACYVVLWSVDIAAWAISVSLGGIAVGAVILSAVTLFFQPATALLYLGVTLFSGGASVSTFLLTGRLSRLFAHVSTALFRRLKAALIRKEPNK